MDIPKSLKIFVESLAPQKEPGPPGSGQERAAQGKITKRERGSSLFGSKPFLTRQRLREVFKKAPPNVPGGGGKYTLNERLALEDKLFPEEKFGAYITPYEVNRKLRELKRGLFHASKVTEKMAIRKQIKFLESLRGLGEKDDK
jgi:hypothetical protein